MLHAERRICTTDAAGVRSSGHGRRARDARLPNLPFISSQSPYFELFRPTGAARRAKAARRRRGRRDLRLGPAADLHARGDRPGRSPMRCSSGIYDARATPFWASIARGDGVYQVYFSNDRVLHLRLGYRSLTLFDHLVHLAELTTLAGVGVRGRAVRHGGLHAHRPRAPARRPRAAARDPRELLPQAVPRVRARGRHPGADAGARDPRLLRGSAAQPCRPKPRARPPSRSASSRSPTRLWRRSTEDIAPGSDDVMVSISQVIDQDVNIFDGAQLAATSERDLFASGVLPPVKNASP